MGILLKQKERKHESLHRVCCSLNSGECHDTADRLAKEVKQ